MFDRHWLGDVALAVLLMLPVMSFARSHPNSEQQSAQAAAISVAAADRLPSGRISLLG
jgi:hypothetical protein